MKPQNIAQWTQNEVETLLTSVVRYTHFVRSTKVALGVLAIFLTGAVLFYPLSKNEDAGIRIAFTGIEKGAASPTQMMNAQFHGFDKSNQPFNVSAKKATQQNDDLMLLDKVTGDISLNSGVWLSMAANTGTFTMKEHMLDLKGAIEMFDDQGYEFRTETMHIDVSKKTAVTHDHVEGQGALGVLKASGAFIDGNKQSIMFDGPVFVTVYPSRQENTQQEKK